MSDREPSPAWAMGTRVSARLLRPRKRRESCGDPVVEVRTGVVCGAALYSDKQDWWYVPVYFSDGDRIVYVHESNLLVQADES